MYGAFALLFAAVLAVLMILNINAEYSLIAIPIFCVLAFPFRRSLRAQLFVPMGACLPSKPEEGECDEKKSPAALLGIAIFAAFGVRAAIDLSMANGAIIVSALVGIIFLISYYRSGARRYFGFAATTLLAPLLLTMFIPEISAAALWLSVAIITGLFALSMGGNVFSRAAIGGFASRKISDLRDMLKSENPGIRYLTLGFMCNYIEPRLIDALLMSIHDENPACAHVARVALSHIWGPEPEEMIETYLENSKFGKELPDALSPDQMRQLEGVHKGFVRKSDRHQKEVEEFVYEAAAKDSKTLATLISLARGESGESKTVRNVALELLGSTRDHKAYVELVRTMKNETEHFGVSAAEGFRGADSSAVVHLLPICDSPTSVQTLSLSAINSIIEELDSRDPADANQARAFASSEVFRIANSPKATSRGLALLTVAKFHEEGKEIIKAALNDKARFVRAIALSLYSTVEHDSEQVKEATLAGLVDPSAHVRFVAISIARGTYIQEAIPLIIAMAQGEKITKLRDLARLVSRETAFWPSSCKNRDTNL